MQISKTLAAAFAAAALTAIAGSPALASPSTDAGVTYRASPPSSNPHDVFRRNIRIDDAEAKTAMAMKDCDCPMMKGAAASKSGHGG
ncbi:hypothetical protein [Caulobacter sp. LARHSG274]